MQHGLAITTCIHVQYQRSMPVQEVAHSRQKVKVAGADECVAHLTFSRVHVLSNTVLSCHTLANDVQLVLTEYNFPPSLTKCSSCLTLSIAQL